MPRVTEQHLNARRRQIAESAERCFARNGFHATTMQDVIREAGLSAGAVYRYFPSKEALVRHIASETIPELVTVLDDALTAEPPPPVDEILDRVLAVGEKHLGVRLRLAVQVWGEALRDPALAVVVREIYGGLRGRLTLVARRARDSGQLPADCDEEAVGAALFAWMPGYLMQRLLLDDPDRKRYISGVRALLGSRG